MKKVLLLTAGFGEGHNAAARNLAAAFDELEGPGCAHVADILAAASPRLNAVSRRAYLQLINRAPHLWRRLYAWLDRSPAMSRHVWLLRSAARVLAAEIERTAPDLICSTYPVYAFMRPHLRRAGCPRRPFFNVVTDSLSINSLWWRAGADAWFLPNHDSADVLLRAGLPASRVHVLGFPVATQFARRPAAWSPADLQAGARPRVLFLVHSGTRHAAATARRLLACDDWEITCAVGRDERLRRELTALGARRRGPAMILGWTNRIPELLMTHHVVISKAGGATTQESIAALCPMIVNQIVPGQEEGNYELLRRHGVGALARSSGETINALQRAFAAGGAVWRDWRDALSTLARPDAAHLIARHVLANSGLPDQASVGPA